MPSRLSYVVALATVLLLAGSSSQGLAAQHRCHQRAFASGELTTKGISCTDGARVITRALARPGCKPTAEDAMSARGCYGSTRVGSWTCSGLFPGEGFDLRCKSGKRRIHGSAGG